MESQGQWPSMSREAPVETLWEPLGEGHVHVSPIIIHDCQRDADVLHAVLGDVEDEGLVVAGVECVLFDGCLALLQPPPFTH